MLGRASAKGVLFGFDPNAFFASSTRFQSAPPSIVNFFSPSETERNSLVKGDVVTSGRTLEEFECDYGLIEERVKLVALVSSFESGGFRILLDFGLPLDAKDLVSTPLSIHPMLLDPKIIAELNLSAERRWADLPVRFEALRIAAKPTKRGEDFVFAQAS
jgi:hypothetical protein